MTLTLKTNLKAILLVGAALLAVSSQFTGITQTVAILLGHFAFSLNMLIITWLAKIATEGAAGQGSVKRRPGLILLLGGLKFSALIGILFASIVWFQMHPLFIGGGALIGLITFLWLFIVRYLKDMTSTGH